MTPIIRSRAVLSGVAVLASLGAGGVAVAAQAPDSTTSVSPREFISAPQNSPIDFPGARTARQGKPLPRGYTVVARKVKITRGGEVAWAALRLTCPSGKTMRTGGSRGAVGLQPTRGASYVGKRSMVAIVNFDARATGVGETAEGTVYGLCR
ncbi:MAG: hypothetical protein H0T43_01330 [Solirubrobacterales bacterium]|nr:hypothetical protein [Solirubrobacterales bacterium]